MKKLIDQVTKVIKSLNKNGFTFTSDDSAGSDDHQYLDVDGSDFVVGDDNDRCQWDVMLDHVQGHGDLKEALISALGQPSNVYPPPREGYNWKPSKNVLVVWFGDRIEFFQDYTKV